MRKVVLATPCFDRSVGADYHFSVVQSVKLCAAHDIDLCPLLWPGEALVQHARNALTTLALSVKDATDVVWIDADHEWAPEQLLRLLAHDVAVVGAAYPKKSDEEQYTVRAAKIGLTATELWQVEGVGTGFLRVSREALQAVYDRSDEYVAWGQKWRMVFDVQVVDGRLWGEDMLFCEKLKAAGYVIHLDPSFTVAHHGAKKYTGDFNKWMRRQAS